MVSVFVVVALMAGAKWPVKVTLTGPLIWPPPASDPNDCVVPFKSAETRARTTPLIVIGFGCGTPLLSTRSAVTADAAGIWLLTANRSVPIFTVVNAALVLQVIHRLVGPWYV